MDSSGLTTFTIHTSLDSALSSDSRSPPTSRSPSPSPSPPPSPRLLPSTTKDVNAARVAVSGDFKIAQRLYYKGISGLPANLPPYMYEAYMFIANGPDSAALPILLFSYYEMAVGRVYEVTMAEAAKFDLPANLFAKSNSADHSADDAAFVLHKKDPRLAPNQDEPRKAVVSGLFVALDDAQAGLKAPAGVVSLGFTTKGNSDPFSGWHLLGQLPTMAMATAKKTQHMWLEHGTCVFASGRAVHDEISEAALNFELELMVALWDHHHHAQVASDGPSASPGPKADHTIAGAAVVHRKTPARK